MWGDEVKRTWALRLKDESKEEGQLGEFYFQDDAEGVTDDLQEATLYNDKEQEIEYMKKHEEFIIRRYGEDAVINYGYTNMMKHFEFVEVEVVDVE